MKFIYQNALIVETSEFSKQFFIRLLKKYKIKPHIATSSSQAIEMLKSGKVPIPDVMFVNRSIEGLDGLQVLKAIKASPAVAKIPVLTYTSSAGKIITSHARMLGAIGVIPRAFRPTEIEKAVEELRSTSVLAQGDHSKHKTIKQPAELRPSAANEKTLASNLDWLADLAASHLDDPSSLSFTHTAKPKPPEPASTDKASVISEASLKALLENQRQELCNWMNLSHQNLIEQLSQHNLRQREAFHAELKKNALQIKHLKYGFQFSLFTSLCGIISLSALLILTMNN